MKTQTQVRKFAKEINHATMALTDTTRKTDTHPENFRANCHQPPNSVASHLPQPANHLRIGDHEVRITCARPSQTPPISTHLILIRGKELIAPAKVLARNPLIAKVTGAFSSTHSVAFTLATEQTNCEDFHRHVQRAFMQSHLRFNRH